MFCEAKRACNERKYDISDALLEEIRNKIDCDIPGNLQVLLRLKLANEWNKKKEQKEEIDRGYFVKQLKEILGNTIPYEMIMVSGEKYLTQNEISCFHNIMSSINWNYPEMRQCVTMLYDLFEKQRCMEECFDMYEFVMGAVASNLGNIGEYDQSNEIGLKILRYELIYRRIGRTYKEIYSLLWNDVQREKNQHPRKRGVDTKKELLRCIYLCEICGDLHQLPFFYKKLEQSK